MTTSMGNAVTAKIVNTVDNPASDEAIVVAAIAFANGAPLTLRLGNRRLVATPAHRRVLVGQLDRAIDGRNGIQDIVPLVGVVTGVKLTYVATVGEGSVRLETYRHFRSVRAVLAMAVVLTMEKGHEVESKVCRCKWQQCEAPFFIAQRNPRGGPANRTYCRPEHRKLHHDSSGRRLGKV